MEPFMKGATRDSTWRPILCQRSRYPLAVPYFYTDANDLQIQNPLSSSTQSTFSYSNTPYTSAPGHH